MAKGAKQGEINKAQASQPKYRRETTIHKGGQQGYVKDDVAKAFHTPDSAMGEVSLAGAVSHLHSEHPIKHDDLGPHHGGTDHVRHMPHPYQNKEHK